MPAIDPISAALDRQQLDRQNGRLRVTLAFGEANALLHSGRKWAEQSGRGLVIWRGGGLGEVFRTIAAEVERRQETHNAALRSVLAVDAGGAPFDWNDVPNARRKQLLEAACPVGPRLEVVSRLLSLGPTDAPHFWTRERFRVLLELCADARLPLLLGWAEPFSEQSFDWVDALLETAPEVPTLLGAPGDGRAILERAAREGYRAAVLLSESVVIGNDNLFPRPSARTCEPDTARTDSASAGETPEVSAARQQALEEVRSGRTARVGPYDSAAEAFLALILETHPVTANLFKPQGEPGFAMPGGRGASVDFLADGVRIALEVDGPHHLEPVQYRRDRHKDLELQSRGYVVLRFLAEDVAGDFESVRATINRVVLARTRGSPEFPV